MHKGALVVFDGGEGSGKSTVCASVASLLNGCVVRTREPGGTAYAERIRELILDPTAGKQSPETMFGLFWAARAAHIQQLLVPKLEEGKVVVCDRFDSSTWAYQIRGQEQNQLVQLFWVMREHYLKPLKNWSIHYIICDVDPRIGLARVQNRGGAATHFDARELEFHERVRAGFLEFAHWNDPEIAHTIINANHPAEMVRDTATECVRDVMR